MEWLWQSDQTVLRAIAHDARQPWLNPIMTFASALGLGHLQAFGLLAPLTRKQPLPWWGHVIAAILGAALGWISSGDLRAVNAAAGATLTILFLPLKREWRAPAIGAILLAGAFHALIKFVAITRERPSNFSWVSPLENVYSSPSFPSGHTSTSFAIAFALYILLREHSQPFKIAIIPLAMAAIIGVSRVYVGVHWPTDVLAGALVGIAAASILSLIRNSRPAKPRTE